MPAKNDKSTLEAEVEAYLVKRVEALGGMCLKLRPPTGRGFPDRTCLLPGGYVLFVELKRPVGGRVADHQDKWATKITARGFGVGLACTTQGVDALLDHFRKWYCDREG